MALRPSCRGFVRLFVATDVLRTANECEAGGTKIIHLQVGQPGSSAPEPVLGAAQRELASEVIG